MRMTRSQTKKREQRQITESMSQDVLDSRIAIVSNLLALLRTSDYTQTQSYVDRQVPTSLDAVRQIMWKEVNEIVAQATANDDDRYDQINTISVIETARIHIVKVLQQYDDREMPPKECADEIQATVNRLAAALNRRPPNACKFAAGVLIMILENVVDRAAPDDDLYKRLMSDPPSQDEQLSVVRVLRVGEDVLQPYIEQIDRILTKLDEMDESLLPKQDMIQKLRVKIPPTLNRDT